MTTGTSPDAIMAPTEMEEATSPIDQVDASIEPTEPLPPRSRRLWGLSPRWEGAGWRPVSLLSPERRWTAALAAALLVTTAGLALLYLDDSSNQSANKTLTTQNESLTGRNQLLTDELKLTQTNLTATLGELAQVRTDLEHPHLVMWNVPQTINGSKWYLAGGVPDTFTYHLVATSTGPMNISILTFDQFAKAIACIDNGVGPTNYCMHHSGAVLSFLNVTSVNYDFHASEGCASYVSVFTSAGSITVTPDVSVTYNPAKTPTGVCAK